MATVREKMEEDEKEKSNSEQASENRKSCWMAVQQGSKAFTRVCMCPYYFFFLAFLSLTKDGFYV